MRTDKEDDSQSGCVWFDYITEAEEMEKERGREKSTHYINKDYS